MEGADLQSTSTPPLLTIGTRGSPLALAQAHEVRRRLLATHGTTHLDVKIEIISTAGDRSQAANTPMGTIGGKGLFSKEIEDRLLDGSIDIGVHSSKDMATHLPEGLIMPIFLPREDVRDAFISHKAKSLDDLPEGAIIGTSSIRRRAQLKRYRPDLQMIEFRGNVGTRLKKLEDNIADATLLAAAGLLRTDQAEKITAFLDEEKFPPAPAQGAIGIELRADNKRAFALIQPLNHPETTAAVLAERAFLRVLDGSCRTPIAALTKHLGTQIALFGQILTHDGQECFEVEISGAAADADAIGEALGHQLLELAGPAFIEKIRSGA